LTLPAKVAFDNQGFIRGRFSDTDVDPFEWTEDRLLLTEAFARLDLGDRRAVKAWMVGHGALDPFDFLLGDGELPDDGEWVERRPPDAFAESRREWAQEQSNVRWHLDTILRLSESRESKEWPPAWGEFVLDGGSGDTYLMGGEHSGTELWSDHTFDFVERIPEARERYGDPAFQRALRPEVARRPRVYVRASAWYGWWAPEPIGNEMVKLRPELADAGATWESMLDVERMLIEPYVARAVERRFRIRLEPRDDGRPVLVPREERIWLSILAPVYLQLFEALRRVSEGEPGAATCHECGRPFVVLDARRRFFCNERERYRHAKRQQRRRLAEPDLVLEDGIEVEIKLRRSPR
jgi:hypothetical protein